jgi:perosamine synthetase
VALFAAVSALGLRQGDEVLVPTLAPVAVADAVAFCGAKPIPVGVEADTWMIDPAAAAVAVTSKSVGIIAVHLYGHPCDMDRIMKLAGNHSLWVVEDATVAHGAAFQGRPAGSFGQAAAFGFGGGRILTTGEGGMVVTGDAQLADRLRELRGKRSDAPGDGHSPPVRLNARMTNLSAALGLSQLRKADFLIETRRRIAGWYRSELDGVAKISTRPESTTSRSVYWLFSVRFLPAEKNPLLRESLRSRLKEDGIETRPFCPSGWPFRGSISPCIRG